MRGCFHKYHNVLQRQRNEYSTGNPAKQGGVRSVLAFVCAGLRYEYVQKQKLTDYGLFETRERERERGITRVFSGLGENII